MMDLDPNLHPLNLAAIIYRPADDVDGLLATFASDLICEGNRVGGIVQKNTKGARGTRELMEVIDLMTGAAIRICQSLGSGAGACKLDPAGLAEAATAVSRAVAAECGPRHRQQILQAGSRGRRVARGNRRCGHGRPAASYGGAGQVL